MNNGWKWGCGLVALAMVTGCELDTVVPVSEMPVSENGVFTDDGRFFVVGDAVLYEVTGGPDSFTATPILEEDCYLGGLTDRGNELFATCNDQDPQDGLEQAEILRIDPSDPNAPVVDRAPFPIGTGIQLLNGMDFGPDGALYVSNSGSFFAADPAIYRVRITDEASFTIEVDTFIDATALGTLPGQGGGLVPNGIHFDGDRMYFVRGLTIARTRLRSDGSHGPLRDVYRSGLMVIDDFDIYKGHMVITQLNPLAFFDPELFPSEVVAADLDGVIKGVERVPFMPSSAAVRENSLFGPRAVVLTSFFNGGLYRLRPRR